MKRQIQKIVNHMIRKGNTRQVIHVDAVRDFPQIIQRLTPEAKQGVGITPDIHNNDQAGNTQEQVDSFIKA